MPDTAALQLLTRRATLAPSTFNAEARTVDVIWTTGVDMPRTDHRGAYIERLGLEPSQVDLSRLIGGPVLNSHNRRTVGDVIGAVTAAHVDGARGIATLKFSARADVAPIVEDVRAGILRDVSVGYSVEKWTDSTDEHTGDRVRLAIRWTPQEISFVPVGADPGATTRARKDTPMPDAIDTTDRTQETAEQRAAAVEQTRVEAITEIARSMKLGDIFAAGHARAKTPLEEFRGAAVAEYQRLNPATPNRTQIDVTRDQTFDNPEFARAAMAEGLFARIDPTHKPSPQAREFASLSISEMCREHLRLRGIRTTGIPTSAILLRDFGGAWGVSDFPLILGNTVGRVLLKGYEAAQSGIKQFLARETSARDFRTKRPLKIGEFPNLSLINPQGEFHHGSITESGETYGVLTYGNGLNITIQALTNDDTGAFTDLPVRMGRAAAETEVQLLVDLIQQSSGTGPLMSDGVRLFNSAHGNTAPSGAVISETSLGARTLAMRKQTEIGGKAINLAPAYLLTPADIEVTAKKQLAVIQATQVSNVNVFTNLQLIVESRLTDTKRWYLVASPTIYNGLEYAYLEGQRGPIVETQQGWTVLGLQMRVYEHFGAGFVEYRSWQTDPGA
jgi:phage head maturation protease